MDELSSWLLLWWKYRHSAGNPAQYMHFEERKKISPLLAKKFTLLEKNLLHCYQGYNEHNWYFHMSCFHMKEASEKAADERDKSKCICIWILNKCISVHAGRGERERGHKDEREKSQRKGRSDKNEMNNKD